MPCGELAPLRVVDAPTTQASAGPRAIDHYNKIIEVSDGVDYVTQEMVIPVPGVIQTRRSRLLVEI